MSCCKCAMDASFSIICSCCGTEAAWASVDVVTLGEVGAALDRRASCWNNRGEIVSDMHAVPFNSCRTVSCLLLIRKYNYNHHNKLTWNLTTMKGFLLQLIVLHHAQLVPSEGVSALLSTVSMWSMLAMLARIWHVCYMFVINLTNLPFLDFLQ